MLEHPQAFAAGGAGEYFSLTLEEYSQVVCAAISQAAGQVPVLAGCGYGTRKAIAFARAAEDAGSRRPTAISPILGECRTRPA